MANPFQRYQSGGFEAVPGIAQAGANIGQMLGSGFSNFGSAIGSGIKQYYENKAKSTAAMQEIEVLGPQLLARRNAYLEASGIDPAMLDRYMTDDPSEGTDDEMFRSVASNPMVQLARTLDPAIDALKNAPTKGLSAQLSALNSGKAAIGMVDEQIKLQDFVSKYRLEQTLNDLPDSVLAEETITTPDALFDPNDPLFTNVNKVRADLKAAGFDDAKIEEGVKKYLKQSGDKIRADETLGTPEQREALIDALTRYSEGKLDTGGNLTDYGQEDAYVEGVLSKIQKDKEAAAAAEEAAKTGQPPPKPMTPGEAKAREVMSGLGLTKDVQDAISKKAAEDNAKRELTPTKGGMIDKTTQARQRELDPLYKKLKFLDAQIEDFTGGKQMPSSRRVVRSETPESKATGAALAERTKVERGELLIKIKEIEQKYNKLAAERDTRLGKSGAELAVSNIAARNEKTEDKVAATAGVTPLPKEGEKPRSKPFSVGELELGTEIVERRLNAAEKETAAREFYSKRFGSVPPGFTQMYRQMFPEASIRTTEVNGIPVMIDGKGNVTALTSNKEQDNTKIAENKAVTFQNTEIADGVVLNGIFSGTVAGAMSFRKDYSHMANVRSAVDELIKINEMGYETLSPTARARADQLQSEIIAAMRIPIVGPGQVAIPEQQILERIIQKGTGFFTLESAERAALKGLKDRMERELVNWPKSMGLEVKIGGKSSDTIKALRMQKLRSSRSLKPTGEAK